jgi:acetamidase/formamidase
VEGAEPGDTLEVRIESIRLGLPYAVNMFLPGLGVLPEEFPYEHRKIIPLDEKRMVARFAPGIEIPLRPFYYWRTGAKAGIAAAMPAPPT